MRMKKMMMGFSFFAAIVTLSTLAMADGGNFPTFGQGLPDTKSWENFISGTFSARYQPFGDKPEIFLIDIVLWKPKKTTGGDFEIISKVYQVPRKVTETSKDICSYSDSELLAKYAQVPKNQGIQDTFGPDKIPVLTELFVTSRKNCGNPHDAQISGTIKIELVPKP